MAESHAVVVLAAGASARLGRPKQLLTIGGNPLLVHVLELAAATKAEHIVVVLGANAEQLAPLVDAALFKQVACIVNPEWQEGIATSLRRAASELVDRSGRTLILGCDQPRLHAEHLVAMLEAATRNPDHDIASRYNDVVGIPALVRASTLAQSNILRGDRGLRALWRDAPDDVITIDAP
ncbi:MAG: nucleotidyltransferase family protein, partial [Dokdonella sp.]